MLDSVQYGVSKLLSKFVLKKDSLVNILTKNSPPTVSYFTYFFLIFQIMLISPYWLFGCMLAKMFTGLPALTSRWSGKGCAEVLLE